MHIIQFEIQQSHYVEFFMNLVVKLIAGIIAGIVFGLYLPDVFVQLLLTAQTVIGQLIKFYYPTYYFILYCEWYCLFTTRLRFIVR